MAQSNTPTPPPASPAKPKCCPKCGNALVGGIKYQDVCTVCEPVYLTRCCSCYRLLWNCFCVRPSTWE